MTRPLLVFTDLDGTLLNHHDYDWSAARPALAELARRQIPLILVSSKTDREMRPLRRALGNTDPLVCENGSLILIPEAELASLGLSQRAGEQREGYLLLDRGVPRERILAVLEELAREFRFTGFSAMTLEEIARHTGLSQTGADAAARRRASEPLLWQDRPEALDSFRRLLAQRGLRLVQGGRFHHVMGQCDKGDAVRDLQKLYAHRYGAEPLSIALGDSPNDLDMLRQVEAPVIVPHRDGARLDPGALKGSRVAPTEGAAGWNEAVLSLIRDTAR